MVRHRETVWYDFFRGELVMKQRRLVAAPAVVLMVVAAVAASCDTSVDEVEVPDAALADAAPVDADEECAPFEEPLAMPGDEIDETYSDFAQPFFGDYCTRCHSSELTGAERNGAPTGLDWDVEQTVRDNLSRIRHQVGVSQAMPLSAPYPSCAEREALVRWIDAGAP